MAESEATSARFRAAIVAIGPAVLLAGFFYHPYISPATDSGAIADAVAADTTRWGLAHLTIGVGYALIALAFLAIRSYLREAGEEHWSARSLPLIVMGSTLFAVLVGMEFAPLTAVETGGDASASQTELFPWFLPIFLTGAFCFGLGAIGFAMGIMRSGVLDPQLARLVAGALVVMALVRFIPLAVTPYVMSVAGLVALWPMAYKMWKEPAARPVVRPSLKPAT